MTEDRRPYYKAKYQRLAEAGLCRNCAKRPANGRTLCEICAQLANERQNKRYTDRKQQVVDYMGGACELCKQSYPICVYDLHHMDPTRKGYEFGGNMLKRPLKELKQELADCALLCANCHRMLHAGL